jgi:hypothetical protein
MTVLQATSHYRQAGNEDQHGFYLSSERLNTKLSKSVCLINLANSADVINRVSANKLEVRLHPAVSGLFIA